MGVISWRFESSQPHYPYILNAWRTQESSEGWALRHERESLGGWGLRPQRIPHFLPHTPSRECLIAAPGACYDDCMSPDVISELLSRQPFQPFRLKFSNQESVDAENPSLVVVLKRDLFVADPSRDRFHIYALIHIVGIDVDSSRAA